MFKLTTLSNEPKQRITVLLKDTTRLVLDFEYIPNQIGWFFGFEYNGNRYDNIRLTTSYNILRAYRKWLTFGIRCDTLDGEEPMDLNDFRSGYAKIYVLTKEELELIESKYYVKERS